MKESTNIPSQNGKVEWSGTELLLGGTLRDDVSLTSNLEMLQDAVPLSVTMIGLDHLAVAVLAPNPGLSAS